MEMTGILVGDLRLIKGEALSDRAGVTGKLFVVRSGAFKSETPLRAGERRVLGLHEAGDFMSAEPTLGGARDAEWVAVKDSTVCVVEPWKLQALAAKHPALGSLIMRITATALARAQQTLYALGGLRASGRLAWFLLDLSQRRRRRRLDPLALSLALTGKDLGNHLGLRPETVRRGWDAMERSGLISRHGQDVQLLNLDRLAAQASGRDVGAPARNASVERTTRVKR